MSPNFEMLSATALDVALTHLAVSATIVIPLLLLLKAHARWSAALRHRLLQGATLLVLALAFVPLLPAIDARLPAGAQTTPHKALESDVARAVAPADSGASRSVVGPTLEVPMIKDPSPEATTAVAAIVAVWLFGSSCLLLRLALLILGGIRLRRKATPIGRNAPELLPPTSKIDGPIAVCDGIDGPLTLGIRRPLVILPKRFLDTTSPEVACAVIRHEMGHVTRGDNIDELIGQLLLALFWFNPILHLLHGARIIEREAACDDLAVSSGVSKRDYGLFLIELAGRTRAPAALAVSVGAGAKRRLKSRLQVLFSERRRHDSRPSSSDRRLSVTAFAVLCIIGISFLPRVQMPAFAAEPIIENPPELTVWADALYVAVLAGEEESVLDLVASSPPADEKQRHAILQSALTMSVESRQMPMFELLLSAGADWRGADGSGGRILADAAHWWPGLIPVLLELGADPNGAGGAMLLPLTSAARNPDPRALELLLEAGADPNAEHRGMVPLMGPMLTGAGRASLLDNMERLIAAGADVDIETTGTDQSLTWTPLSLAIEVGEPLFVELLLRHGADPNHTIDKHYGSEPPILVSPLLLAEARDAALGKPLLAPMLKAAGGRHQTGAASLEEILAARSSMGARAIPLQEQDRLEIVDSIRQLADDLPPDVSLDLQGARPVIVEPDGKYSLDAALKAWPIAEHRKKSYSVACSREPDALVWNCVITKPRYRQRLNTDSRWFTVSGDIPEDTVRQMVSFAASRVSGCTLAPRYITDVSPRYVVFLMDERDQPTEVQIVVSDGQLIQAAPVKTSDPCQPTSELVGSR